eukprot:scaffold380_cov272-Pinguiococcus_pyrenoidosus.AAC.17
MLLFLMGLAVHCRFMDDRPDLHTSNYTAIAIMYLAQFLENSEDPERQRHRASRMFTATVELFSGDRLAIDQVEMAARRLGASVPEEVLRPPHDSVSGPFLFAEAPSLRTIAGNDFPPLEAGQLELVVLLSLYRANGPYYYLMRELHMLARALQQPRGRLSGISVITCHSSRRFTWEWIENERAMIQEGLNIRVWHIPEDEYLDAEESLERAWDFEIDGSPFLFVRTPDDTCFPAQLRERDEDMPVALWDLLTSNESQGETAVAVASEFEERLLVPEAAVTEVPVALSIDREGSEL